VGRRGRGEGSIFQLPDGKWVAVVSCGREASGKRLRKTFYGESKAEVLEKRDKFRSALSGGLAVNADSKQSVRGYLTTWLVNVKPTVRLNTYTCYEDTVKRYIEPHLGATALDKVTPVHIRATLAALEADGKSPRVRQLTHAVLRRALGQACEDGLITRSPVPKESPKVEKRTMVVWTDEQAREFLAVARRERLWALYVVALFSGMREGEILGLQWSDIDLRTGIISVQHNLVESRGKILGLFPPKTGRGARTVSLPDTAVSALQAQKARLLEEGLGVAGYVFPSRTGTPINKHNLLRAFKAVCLRAGVPKIRFHDLRHTNATLLLQAGIHPKVVADRLGHADVSMTLNIYSHAVQGLQAEAGKKLEDLLK
jgi:integrase